MINCCLFGLFILLACYFEVSCSDVFKRFNPVEKKPFGIVADILNSFDANKVLRQKIDKYRHPSTYSHDSLRFVYVVARHGARAPLFTFPTDAYPFYDERYWPDGPGHMTKVGKQQEYEVGKKLRARYNEFISPNFSPNETKILTNRSPRDFETAACIAAGLFPPVGYQLWNPDLLWNPVIIDYEDFDVNKILSTETCPQFLSEAVSRVTDLDSLSYKYRKVIEYVGKHSGTKHGLLSEVAPIYDTFLMQEQNNLPLPTWAKRVYPDKLKLFYALYFNTVISGSERAIRFTAPTLMLIWKQLKEKVSGNLSPNLKMTILAGHDTTIRSILSALDIDKPYIIDISAYLLIELHENSSGQFVQVIYVNSSESNQGILYDIPKCSTSPCKLEEFGRLAESIQFSSWHDACKTHDRDDLSDPEDLSVKVKNYPFFNP